MRIRSEAWLNGHSILSAVVFAAQLTALALAHAADPGPSSQQITSLVERYLAANASLWRGGNPALSIVVGRNGEALLARGYGEARPGVSASPETLYRIGSLSKQMTAAVVLSLIEGGGTVGAAHERLSLETDVASAITGAVDWQRTGPPVTVRRLLNMTSNLPNFTRRPPKGRDPWGRIAAGDLLDDLAKQLPSGWPGTFEYSNTNYFLLAALIDRVAPGAAGRTTTYPDAMRALFDRAGMNATSLADDKPLELAVPHFRRRPAFAERDWLRGSADVVSSAIDLFRWDSALMAGKVLGPRMRSEMFSEAARVDPTTYYGMGWFVAERKADVVYSHTGSVAGYTSVNAIAVSKAGDNWRSVTMLANIDGLDDIEQLAVDLLDQMIVD